MTARHSFTRRDEFTCSECFYIRVGEDGPVCARYGDRIRWNAHAYGCAVFATTDSGRQEIPDDLTLWGGRA